MLALWLGLACAPDVVPEAMTEDLEPQAALWLTGAGFDWDLFNHRVSALRFGFAEEAVEVAVVGGTSTTNTLPDLEDVCDPSACSEIPFFDASSVQVGWGHLVTSNAVVGTGTVTLDIPQGGASSVLDIDLPTVPDGEVVALIAGFSVDTAQPLSGDEPACYRPEYGWHPTRISITLADADADATTNQGSVEVAARFDVGATGEASRACIDDVFDRAVVGMTVDVVLLAGVDATNSEVISAQATYELGDGGRRAPNPQSAPPPVALSLEAPVLGWSTLDFTFDSGEGRGSYLRTLDFTLGDGEASGTATNFSPLTQLSGFSYAFEGTVEAVHLDAEVETGTVFVDTLRPRLDDDDRPVFERIVR